jgi:hypothetical protein
VAIIEILQGEGHMSTWPTVTARRRSFPNFPAFPLVGGVVWGRREDAGGGSAQEILLVWFTTPRLLQMSRRSGWGGYSGHSATHIHASMFFTHGITTTF